MITSRRTRTAGCGPVLEEASIDATTLPDAIATLVGLLATQGLLVGLVTTRLDARRDGTRERIERTAARLDEPHADRMDVALAALEVQECDQAVKQEFREAGAWVLLAPVPVATAAIWYVALRDQLGRTPGAWIHRLTLWPTHWDADPTALGAIAIVVFALALYAGFRIRRARRELHNLLDDRGLSAITQLVDANRKLGSSPASPTEDHRQQHDEANAAINTLSRAWPAWEWTAGLQGDYWHAVARTWSGGTTFADNRIASAADALQRAHKMYTAAIELKIATQDGNAVTARVGCCYRTNACGRRGGRGRVGACSRPCLVRPAPAASLAEANPWLLVRRAGVAGDEAQLAASRGDREGRLTLLRSARADLTVAKANPRTAAAAYVALVDVLQSLAAAEPVPDAKRRYEQERVAAFTEGMDSSPSIELLLAWVALRASDSDTRVREQALSDLGTYVKRSASDLRAARSHEHAQDLILERLQPSTRGGPLQWIEALAPLMTGEVIRAALGEQMINVIDATVTDERALRGVRSEAVRDSDAWTIAQALHVWALGAKGRNLRVVCSLLVHPLRREPHRAQLIVDYVKDTLFARARGNSS